MPLTQMLCVWRTGLIGNIGTVDGLLNAHELRNCTLSMLQTLQLSLRPTLKVSCQVLRLAASIMLGPVLHRMIQVASIVITGSAGDLKSKPAAISPACPAREHFGYLLSGGGIMYR